MRSRLASLLVHELQNEARDFVGSLIQGKMTGVEQINFCVGQVAFEGLGTGGDERGIMNTSTVEEPHSARNPESQGPRRDSEWRATE
jgi:hypothetical protein